jgi:hypothetical protein
MAKKAISGAKKAISSAKKAKSATKKPAAKKPAARKTIKTSGAEATARTNPPAVDEHDSIVEQAIALLPPALMDGIIHGVNTLMEDFNGVSQTNLSKLQRRRKIGAGIRNYGFIEKVADLAEANPQFAQFFRPEDLRNCLTNFDKLRDITLLLQSFARLVTNTMLVYSDTAYSLSGIFYNMVKEMSRRGNPTAMELYRTLQPFFHRTKHASSKLTMKQADKDMHAFFRGEKDGFFGVENISPKLTGGVRKIIDKKLTDGESFSEKADGEIKG